ncbi:MULTISPECIES: extracellular solute-binding protein [Bradyrhizobium]|uniref:extracellular solute-binding protein n=1 Tax=Bradyrhizobium centrosematis TaxID=1300039 RepID=UPI00216A8512|nr:extracellular solute-binding protein [Bradyrhizobium centrosematis]MCS3765922.1 putative spermidine/putrescine transport system substrate-binding protein [Bradyrhizobium centrosematis]MCS3778256.1 putative spermidine/putrescine transport system substrate-binding protein [Bradyrhizobium centrosematis]
MSIETREVSRRWFLGEALVGAAALPGLGSRWSGAALAASEAVNFACYGGPYNDNITKAFLQDFEQKTGVKVSLGADASLALAKLQASIDPAQWDIVELTGPEYEVAVKQDLLLPLDTGVVNTAKIPADCKSTHGIKYALFLFVMAWDQRRIPDDKAPKTWAEFWDTAKYPGKRSLSANISDGSALEAALLADGVGMDQLYPLNVDRAFKSLERLGKRNIIWHNTSQEPIQQLSSGEVTLASSFNGRVIPASRSGAKIGFTSEYGGVSGDYLGVVKTSHNANNAFRLINHMITDDQAAAEFMKLTTYTSTNADALKLVAADLADTLPTSPKLKGKVFVKSDTWWAQNLEKTLLKFKQWQLI